MDVDRQQRVQTSTGRTRSGWREIAVTVIIIGLLTVVNILLRPVFPSVLFRIPYVLAIGFIGYLYGSRHAILALLLSFLGFSLVYIPRAYSFWPFARNPDEWVQLVVFLLGGLVGGLAMAGLHNAREVIAERTHELEVEIAERGKALDRLAEQADMLDLSHVFVRDMSGRITYWSAGDEELYGYTRDEALGRISHELLRTVFPKPLRELEDDVLAGSRWQGELAQTGKDGRTVYVASYWAVHRDSSGNPRSIVEANNDITMVKQVEDTLRARERDYRTLSENSPEVIARFDQQLRHTYINEYGARVYGMPREEVIGKTNADLGMPSDKVGYWRERFEEVFATGKQQTVDFDFLSPNLGHLYLSSIFVPEFDDSGKVVSILAITRDITPLREAEANLREAAAEAERNRAQLEAVFQAISDGVLIFDMSGKAVLVNQAEARILGYPSAETMMLDMSYFAEVYELAYPDGRVLTMSEWPVSRVLRGESVLDQELHARRKDTGREWYFSFSGEPVCDEQGVQQLAVVVTRDITEQFEARERTRKLNEELEERVVERTDELQTANAGLEAANKELEAFSYSVSHDLRAPLRAIDGFSSALLRSYSDQLDSKGQDYLSRVRAAAQRMGALIDDILGLSRATRAEVKREHLNLSAMVTGIIDGLRRSEPTRKAEITIEPDIWVEADPHLMQIAMDNLLGNAWKFTSQRDATRIEFGVSRSGEESVYHVSDNGAGFDPEYVAKLFTPFQRLHTESEFPGTGIGLALVHRIIRKHGGRIWAEGAVDKGATFYFTLG